MMSNDGLTKLIEECGELIQVAAKKIAYYETDAHPDGAGSLKARLEDEMGDVLAAMDFVSQVWGLNRVNIETRAKVKCQRFFEWHNNPDNYKPANLINWRQYHGLEK